MHYQDHDNQDVKEYYLQNNYVFEFYSSHNNQQEMLTYIEEVISNF